MRKLILSVLILMMSLPSSVSAFSLGDFTNSVNQVTGAVGAVGGLVSSASSLFGSGSSTTTSGSTGSSAGTAGMFDPHAVFPAWGDGGQVTGVIGTNSEPLNQGGGRLIIYFIPKVVELMIWIVAPIITVMFIYSGLTYIWGGDRDEEIKKAKDFFKYGVIGLTFIVLSYSLMKAVFFILV